MEYQSITAIVPVLPAEYQEVEYIQFTGTQYIDTGVSAPNGFKADLKTVFTDISSGFSVVAAGYDASKSNTRNYFSVIYYDSSLCGFQIGANGYQQDSFETPVQDRLYTITASTVNQTAQINGVTYNARNYRWAGSYSTPYCSFSVLLGAGREGNVSAYSPSLKAKVYYLKLYDSSDVLVRDLVPCYQKSDGVIGMYDLANDVFYTNQGTGTFLKGKDLPVTTVTPAWDTITQVTANASELYINSPVDIPSNTTRRAVVRFSGNPTLSVPTAWKWNTIYSGNSNGLNEIILSYDIASEKICASVASFSNTMTLSNLIANGNMEYDDYWSVSNVTVNSSDGFTFASGTTAMASQNDSSVVPLIAAGPIANHIYYGRCYKKAAADSTFSDGRLEWYIDDTTSGHMVFDQMSATGGEWEMSSARVSIESPVSGSWQIRNFVVSGSSISYRKGLMIIDLTATYGAGNEPSQTWCDNHIAYVPNIQEIPYVESVVRYTSSETLAVPDGMKYADIFLVNGGNGGTSATSNKTYGAGGSGGNNLTQNNISVSGSISITIGSAGAVSGGKGGTTAVVINGTTYNPTAQGSNSKTGQAGTNGTANPFGKIGSTSDSSLYGAQGGCGNYGSSTIHSGGKTGGGDGGRGAASIYGGSKNATAGLFYGAGGGGGGRGSSSSYTGAAAAGYQGCAIIRWKNKIQ